MRLLLAATLAVFFVTPAQAQQQCGPYDNVVRLLADKYGETRQIRGMFPGGEAVMEVWANLSNGTWTIVTASPAGTACIRASGTDYDRADKAPEPAGMRL